MSTPGQAYGSGPRQFTAGSAAVTAPAATAQPDAHPAAAARGVDPEAGAVPRTATGPRKVRLTVARVDPWSVMKLSFLLSVALGIALVVLSAMIWIVLEGMGVFSDVDRTIGEVLGGDGKTFNLMDYIGFGRVTSLATVVAVIDVFLLTALSTLGAFVYNVCSSLVGGLHLTLTDD